MKKIITTSFIVISLIQIGYSQAIINSKNLSEDEKSRVKFSVHLIDYIDPPAFDNAIGQAHYNLVKASFSEFLIVPDLEQVGLTDHDKDIVNKYIELLNGARSNPLTWNHLLQLETQYLIWLDRSSHKKSIYKN